MRPYLQQVADALAAADLAEPSEVEVHRWPSDALAAVLLGPEQEAPALVWDERLVPRPRPVRGHSGARS